MTDPYTTCGPTLIPDAMRTIRMTLATTCPKCALGTLAGPTYQRVPERLIYRCTVCGYREERATADAATRLPDVPTVEQLHKWKEEAQRVPLMNPDVKMADAKKEE